MGSQIPGRLESLVSGHKTSVLKILGLSELDFRSTAGFGVPGFTVESLILYGVHDPQRVLIHVD